MVTGVAMRAAMFAVLAGGVASVAVARGIWGGEGIGSVALVLLFLVLYVASAVRPLLLFRGDGNEDIGLEDAFFVAAALLLAPLGTLIVCSGGNLGRCLLQRQAVHKVAFNVAQLSLATVVGLTVVETLRESGSQRLSPGLLVAVGAGSLVFHAASALAVSVAIASTGERSLTAVATDALTSRLLMWATMSSIGLLIGLGGSAYSWAPVFAILPMAMLHLVLGQHLRARRDRERMDGLLKTAVDAHATIETVDVERSLSQTAQELLRCRASRVDTKPPQAGEWAASLAINADTATWLIVAERKGLEPFDAEDQKLLEAIAAVGSSALENARLVEEIKRQKLHDHLTGLANQLLFQDRVAQAVTQARKNRERLALLALDLDFFKKVNDSLGHTVGNALLQRVAERLTGAAREVDTVARLSGDLFTLLLPGIGTPETAGVVAGKILEALRRPFHIGEHELYMTASVGIALYPDDGNQAEMLLKNADSALHRAKDMGRNRIQIYAADMNELAQVRLARESELHNALRRDELRVLYQPQIDLRSGRIVGVEALVRWEHPRHGLLAPDEFVPLAEESGLITELDFWVMRRACAQLREWDLAGLPPMTVAVNLSGRHFETDRLPDNIAEILQESGLEPARLELEVTEGVAVREGTETLDALRRLRQLGVRFAIDDFGTGYSVLGRLRRFPVDRLKIDRSFISEIKSPSDDAPIVVAMIAMGRSLHLEVVAEGVETLEQQTFLRNHGCDQAQGYLFSRPVAAGDIVRLLETPSRGFSLTASLTESA